MTLWTQSLRLRWAGRCPPVTSFGAPSLSLSEPRVESSVSRTCWAQSCISASCSPAWKALSPDTASADFFSWLLCVLCGIVCFLTQGPQQWDYGVLTTRPPGNSQLILSCHVSVCSETVALKISCSEGCWIYRLKGPNILKIFLILGLPLLSHSDNPPKSLHSNSWREIWFCSWNSLAYVIHLFTFLASSPTFAPNTKKLC